MYFITPELRNSRFFLLLLASFIRGRLICVLQQAVLSILQDADVGRIDSHCLASRLSQTSHTFTSLGRARKRNPSVLAKATQAKVHKL